MAVAEGHRARDEGDSSAGREGSDSTETTDAVRAWNSFCEADGREAGATGAEGASGLTQHAGVEQCLKSQPEQQQPALALRFVVPVPTDTVRTPWQARTNPSRKTTAIFIGRDVMFSSRSLWTAAPYGDCQVSRHEETLLSLASAFWQAASSGAGSCCAEGLAGEFSS